MVQLIEKARCTGCMACEAACPKDAVTRKMDSLGNLYPEINREMCIGCGKCGKACPEQQSMTFHDPQKAFAAWSLDPESRKTSASGGAAAEFYRAALEAGCWICGAEYTSDGFVIHTVSSDPDAIQRYKQSKYVYSDACDAYSEIRRLLEQGEKVLMISLPCKIAGLMSYLGKPYDDLLTVDIVCHGTPPGQMLHRHVMEAAHVTNDFSLCFRQDNQFLFRVFTHGRPLYEKIGREDTYLAAFLEGLSYRDVCYRCRYAQSRRVSDITICDFWGLGQEIPFDHPYSGSISAVLLHTQKGQEFFKNCRSGMFTEERPVWEAVSGNAQLNAPTPVHPLRRDFETGCEKDGFEATVSRLLKEQISAAQRENTKARLHSWLRKAAGVFIKRYRG